MCNGHCDHVKPVAVSILLGSAVLLMDGDPLVVAVRTPEEAGRVWYEPIEDEQ